MKIAFLHVTMGINHRGSEISTHLLAKELAKKHQVLMMQAGPATKQWYQVIRPLKLTQAPVPAPHNIVEKILFRLYQDPLSRSVKQFTRQAIGPLKDFNPDIIIPVNGKPQIQLIKQCFPTKKIVVFGRAGIGYHDKDTLQTNPDVFIALSQIAKSWAKKYAGRNTQIFYLPNPIDTTVYPSAMPTALSVPKPVVITVAAFSRYKNLDRVICSVAKTPASLLLVGQGEEQSALEKLALEKLPGRYQIISAEPDQLPSLYAAADCFCLIPDKQEAFGRVYLEAMTAGLSIVAPDDPIRRRIIGDKGIFTQSSPSSVAAAINHALSMKKIDYSEKLAEYSLQTVVAKLEKVLTKVVQD